MTVWRGGRIALPRRAVRVWPALRLPPGQLLGCLVISGLAADAQLPTPPGF